MGGHRPCYFFAARLPLEQVHQRQDCLSKTSRGEAKMGSFSLAKIYKTIVAKCKIHCTQIKSLHCSENVPKAKAWMKARCSVAVCRKKSYRYRSRNYSRHYIFFVRLHDKRPQAGVLAVNGALVICRFCEEMEFYTKAYTILDGQMMLSEIEENG